ncbi:MAG TPA: FAD-dependent oxidoreductase [Gaiellaceae bacterium]|nr:FAD-dependent oxidoreductase [Gaiellaceae bacterium]
MRSPGTVVIVGAGLAGARCAETLRAEGFDGDIVLVGAERHAPYERPALSKEFLAGKRGLEDLALRPESFWADQEIDLCLGNRVVAVDPEQKTATLAQGSELAWDALVIATGARARRLPFPTPSGVHVLRTVDDAIGLREELGPGKRLCIIGGGFVGAEVASTAIELGLEVTMLEAGPAPFARALGTDVGRLLARRYRRFDVDLRTGVGAAGFRWDGGGITGVALSDGREVECDVALAAVGMERSLDLISPDPEPPVYACGDVAGSRGHWTAAAAEGVDVARRLLGLEPRPRQPAFFWSDQFGLRLQLVGDTSGAERVELEGSDEALVARYLSAEGELLAALAANQPAAVGELRRELAAAA